MPVTKLFKADDGAIHQVVESEALTLDEIDHRIAEVENTLVELKSARAEFLKLDGQDEAAAEATPETAQPAVAGGVELTVTPGAAPEAPAAGEANTAELNNGQVDPAASSNPTPGVPEQPIVGA